jgi:hypothetical protein
MLVACFGNVWGPRRDRSRAFVCSLIRTHARRKCVTAPREEGKQIWKMVSGRVARWPPVTHHGDSNHLIVTRVRSDHLLHLPVHNRARR